MKTSLSTINTVVVGKSHMNIHVYPLTSILISSLGVLVSEMVFPYINLHALNPQSLKSLESIISQFIQMTMQLLNDADEVTMDSCQIQTNDLVVSNAVNHVSLKCIFKINQPESGCQNSKR